MEGLSYCHDDYMKRARSETLPGCRASLVTKHYDENDHVVSFP